jgi:polysaccharide biosynthesis protein PslG
MKTKHLCKLIPLLILLSACQLGAPGPELPVSTATQVAVSVKPTQTLSPTAQAPSQPSPVQAASGTASGGTTASFGAVVGPDYTPPPTDTQVPAPLVISVAPPNGPTLAFGPVVGQGAVVLPTFTFTPPPSAPVGATPTVALVPTLPILPSPGGPTLPFGPVVGPNYTPPPAFTQNAPPTLVPGNPSNATLPPAVTAGPSPTAGPVLRADLMGVQVYGFLTNDQWDRTLGMTKDLGVGWIKIQVLWKQLEPTKGQFATEYNTVVQDIQRAHKSNLHTFISIDKAPDWARPASVRGADDGPPDSPQDLADFVAHFVRDTKPVNIDALEIWNEPNLIREWRGKAIGGAEYMKLFNAVYPTIVAEQQAQPDQFNPNHRITVLTAGPAPTITSADGSTMNDRDWLQQLYDNGLAKYGDDVAVGVHPYGWANPPDSVCCTAQPGVTGWYEQKVFYFRNNLDDYRAIMVKNNDAGSKLWVTEFGWASYDGLRRTDGGAGSVNANSGLGWESLLNQNQQASYVLRAFYLVQQPPYYNFVGPMMLWNLNFAVVPGLIDSGGEEAGFSLLDSGWNARPAYNLLRGAPKTPLSAQ